MNIWEFNSRVSKWLLRWNIINIFIGVIISIKGGRWKGIGSQNIGWGIINILIATFGATAMKKRYHSLSNPQNPAIIDHETKMMRRILQVNSFLDVLYIVGGWRFFQQNKEINHKYRQGIGIGIMVQGTLLFIYDVFLLSRMPDKNDD